MSFFDEASLVMIPSGYKDQKVYSVKPLDGSGDLTFSRASSATRVASNGLIEKVRTNEILYSQEFDNAAWIKQNTSVTANAETAPDGTLTAETMTIVDSTSYVSQASALGAGTYTISCYVKVISTTTAGTVRFNIVYDATGINSSFTPTGDWQRVEVTFTATIGVTNLRIRGDFGSAFVGTLAIWGFQAEVSDFGATDYIPTTTAAVSVGPVSGLPRLDYLNSSCPRLLLEPQRTNQAQFSEQFNNAYWTKTGSTISSNTIATLDPSGYNGADKLVEDSSTGSHVVFTSVTGTSGTYSFFAKAAERSWVSVLANNGNRVYFNLSNGTLGTIAAGSTATITPYGNGWYRCVVFNTHPTFGASIYLATGNDVGTYAGNGTSGAFIWGAQFEASAAYATSYIPTLRTSVTRVADDYAKTGVSSLIGQTEGTVFVDFNINGLQSPYASAISLNDGVPNNYIWLTIFSNGDLRAEVYAGGVVQASIIFSGAVAGGRYKMACGYKTNDFVLYVNGALVGTDTSGSTFSGTTLSRIDNNLAGIAANITSQSTNQALLFKTRLTNAQLAELTAL
jgi:hypothetical protein